MSKERLEEINDMVSAFDESLFVSLYGYELYAPAIVDDFKYLLKRVQELEDRHYRQELIDEHIERLEQQNERYREVLNRIRITTKEGTTYRWARRALEGDLE